MLHKPNAHEERANLILDAQRKGYAVIQDDDGTWLVITPARPRHPSVTLGSYATSDRAWMGACLLASSGE